MPLYTYVIDGQIVTAQTIGSTTFYNTPTGSYTAQNIGNTTFYSGDINATAQNIGSTTFYSGDINATAQNIGSTTFYSGATLPQAPDILTGTASAQSSNVMLNRDSITDRFTFRPGVGKLEIDQAVFPLSGRSLFRVATNARAYSTLVKRNNSDFIYSLRSGNLYYDADPVSRGYSSLELIANIGRSVSLSASDFLLI